MIQFIQRCAEMHRSDLVVKADDRFQKASDAFDAFAMDVTAHPLIGAVVNRVVAGVGVSNAFVANILVCLFHGDLTRVRHLEL